MQIDPSTVKWDEPAQQSQVSSVDPATVQWDEPTQAQTGSSQAAITPESKIIAQDHVSGFGQELARQAGLTARYGMEGLAQAAEVVTEPARKLLTDPAARAMGLPEGKPLGQMAEGLADSIGLPKPANEKERVVGDAARFMAGGAGMAGAAGKVAQTVSPGLLQGAAQAMASSPGMQIASSAGAGAGAGLAREGGGNEWAQLAAGLAGGLSVGGLVQAARSGLQTAANKLLPVRAQKMEQQIEQTLGAAVWTGQRCPKGCAKACAARWRRLCAAANRWMPALWPACWSSGKWALRPRVAR